MRRAYSLRPLWFSQFTEATSVARRSNAVLNSSFKISIMNKSEDVDNLYHKKEQ